MVRRTKIVATLGPASDSLSQIEKLIEAGMDVARLNFSHGEHDEHRARLERTRHAAEKAGRAVAVLQDLCGPKIRTGHIEPAHAQVALGDTVRLVEGSQSTYPDIAIQYEAFAAGLEPGDRVLLDDGRVTVRVVERSPTYVACVAETAGVLRDRVGVHLPARSIRSPILSDKDRDDLKFGLDQGVDYVAVSFVRSAEDLRQVRTLCEEHGRRVPIVAKIETPQAVEAIEHVTHEADAVMVARGDLGVEYSPEEVPVLQKRIIEVVRRQRRPVIVATEMLQSMVRAPRPTRAEASDVAHAVFDGADAVMLSAETATGEHPAQAAQMMARIVARAEESGLGVVGRPDLVPRRSLAESIAFNAADVAEEVGANVLVAFSATGLTARLVSQARPRPPIVAFSSSPDVCRRMALYWGVMPSLAEPVRDGEQMAQLAARWLLDRNMLQRSECYVLVYGAPVGSGSGTNSLSVRIA